MLYKLGYSQENVKNGSRVMLKFTKNEVREKSKD